MLTMSRLPSDSFLPSGGVFANDQHAGFYRHNDVSPLSLPHSIQQPPTRHYQFDNLASRISSDSNPHASINRSRSPRLTPPSSDLDKRTRSLSPSGRHTNAHAWIGSPSLSAVSGTSLDNNLDASALALQLRRVTLQNRRLLENWEAERTHLEANRARAEEVYREERDIMDEERDLWMQQKTSLELKIVELEQRAQQAESQRETFARQLEFMSKQARVSPRAQGHDSNARVSSIKSQIRSKSVSPPTSGSASIRYLSPRDGISPLTGKPFAGTGITMPESNPFVPLDQRMQGPSPGSTSPDACPAQIPSIDVSEVVPQLEGIRLKQPAIEKPTFTVVEPSATSSPTGAKAQSPSAGSPHGSPDNKSRSSPVERAIQALQAPEHSRLTMHAGHTPNHSMSFSKLPTLMSTASGNTANTAGSSGAVTPNEPLEMGHIAEHGSKMVTIAPAEISHSGLEDGQAVSEDPHAIFEPSEGDRPLTGPTHLMNRPAVDEPFLALLSEKLQTADPIPTVVRNALSEEAEAEAVQQSQASAGLPALSGNDGAADTPQEPETIEQDIPLKFKGGSNFGLPYGDLGSFGR